LTDDLQHQFLQQIKKKMQEKNINRAELARRLDVTPSRVTQMFYTNRNLRFDTACRLVRALDCKLVFTMEEEDHETEDETSTIVVQGEELAEGSSS